MTVRGLLSSASLMDLSSCGLRAATGEVTFRFSLVLGVLTVFWAGAGDLVLGDNLDFSLSEAASLSSSVSALDFTGDLPAPPMVRG